MGSKIFTALLKRSISSTSPSMGEGTEPTIGIKGANIEENKAFFLETLLLSAFVKLFYFFLKLPSVHRLGAVMCLGVTAGAYILTLFAQPTLIPILTSPSSGAASLVDRVASAGISAMNGDAKLIGDVKPRIAEETNDKSKIWKITEISEPSQCRSFRLPKNLRVTKVKKE